MVVIGGIGWDGCDNASTLGCEDAVHGEDVHFGVDAEGCFDSAADKFGAGDFEKLVNFATGVGYALEGHVASGTIHAEVGFLIVCSEYAVFEGRTDKTVGLAVPTIVISIKKVDERVGIFTWFLDEGWQRP